MVHRCHETQIARGYWVGSKYDVSLTGIIGTHIPLGSERLESHHPLFSQLFLSCPLGAVPRIFSSSFAVSKPLMSLRMDEIADILTLQNLEQKMPRWDPNGPNHLYALVDMGR